MENSIDIAMYGLALVGGIYCKCLKTIHGLCLLTNQNDQRDNKPSRRKPGIFTKRESKMLTDLELGHAFGWRIMHYTMNPLGVGGGVFRNIWTGQMHTAWLDMPASPFDGIPPS